MARVPRNYRPSACQASGCRSPHPTLNIRLLTSGNAPIGDKAVINYGLVPRYYDQPNGFARTV